MGTVALYALVIDHSGAVTLRVAAEGVAGARGVRSKRALREAWGPLGVPVVRATRGAARPKDYRRRWPEAFGIFHAYPLLTVGLAPITWMLLVVPILDRVAGG